MSAERDARIHTGSGPAMISKFHRKVYLHPDHEGFIEVSIECNPWLLKPEARQLLFQVLDGIKGLGPGVSQIPRDTQELLPRVKAPVIESEKPE